jgi:hypothetical protein
VRKTSPSLRFDPPTVQPFANRYPDLAIKAPRNAVEGKKCPCVLRTTCYTQLHDGKLQSETAVCVQCTVQSETVVCVRCTVQSETAVCVRCTVQSETAVCVLYFNRFF